MACLTWLRDRFTEQPQQTFMIWRDQPFTYDWLTSQITTWEARLDQAALPPGSVVAINGDYSPTVVALLLALIDRRTILVPLTASVAAHHEEFTQIAEVQWEISLDEHEQSRITRYDRDVRNALTRGLIATGDPGLILFSSGSTGKSKAALHNFMGLLEKFKPRRHSMVTLTFLLLDHIGGINTLLYVLSNTGCIVTVHDRNPDVVCSAIARHRVEVLPTSPTFLNLLLMSEAYKRHDFSSLKRITYGTEPMPEQTLQRLHTILPDVELLQTYGLSELGIMRSKSRSSDSLWVKVGGEGFETRIQDGTLWLRARSAMLGYLNAPSPFDAEGWFNTGDAVEVDGEYIKILGRRSELINVGGTKVYPAEVEGVLLQMPNVRDVAVVGEANPITGQVVVARVNLHEPEDLSLFRRRMRAFCRDRLATYKIPARVELVETAQYSERFKKMRRRQDPALEGDLDGSQ
jgi:acyl-CoA synthetase (AMP-forming)/AMP-acid ligase II